VQEGDRATAGEGGEDGLQDGEERDNGEGECRPVDEGGVDLVSINGKERPGNGDGTSNVTLWGGEGVGGRGGFEEQQRKEDKDFGPDAGLVDVSVDAKCLESGEDDENGGPAVVEGEGEVDPEFVIDVLATVRLLDDIVDVGDSGRDQESENEGDDVMLTSPDVDVDGVEGSEEREAPADTVDDGAFSVGEELVDHCAAEKEVDQGPDGEGPGGGGEVSLFAMAVDVGGAGDGVDV